MRPEVNRKKIIGKFQVALTLTRVELNYDELAHSAGFSEISGRTELRKHFSQKLHSATRNREQSSQFRRQRSKKEASHQFTEVLRLGVCLLRQHRLSQRFDLLTGKPSSSYFASLPEPFLYHRHRPTNISRCICERSVSQNETELSWIPRHRSIRSVQLCVLVFK